MTPSQREIEWAIASIYAAAEDQQCAETLCGLLREADPKDKTLPVLGSVIQWAFHPDSKQDSEYQTIHKMIFSTGLASAYLHYVTRRELLSLV
jgi:hypothetical protein